MTFCVQKMPTRPANYFRYFAATRDIATWGLGVTAAGFTHIPPGSPYPPAQHPSDHALDWTRGRVLDALQIVLISRGRGRFESKATGEVAVEVNTAFVLLPRVWHRYRPDPATGWEESWVELQGPVVHALRRAGHFKASAPLRSGGIAAGLDSALAAVHVHSRTGSPGFDPERAAAALGVLAAWVKAGQSHPSASRMTRAVVDAERHLAEHHTEAVNIEALAKKLGVAYSHFRRAFRQHTGFAPWQYVMHLRLSRARRMMTSSDATLDEIAAQLGFSSAFHLSAAFKQAHGAAPQHWRRQRGQK